MSRFKIHHRYHTSSLPYGIVTKRQNDNPYDKSYRVDRLLIKVAQRTYSIDRRWQRKTCFKT